MSNIDPKIASHASMWLKNAEQIERQIVRLTSDELEAYLYIRDIFKLPEPDMERLQVAQDLLRDVGSELHDDFGAAVKNFAAKVSVIVRDFDTFRTAVNEKKCIEIGLSTNILRSKPALSNHSIINAINYSVSDKLINEPNENRPKKIKISNTPHYDSPYYYGFVDEDGQPHGEGEYYDGEKKIFGIFNHGLFPDCGKVVYHNLSTHREFTGKFNNKRARITVAENKVYGTELRFSFEGIVTLEDGSVIEADRFNKRLLPVSDSCNAKYPDGAIIEAYKIFDGYYNSVFEGTKTNPDGSVEFGHFSEQWDGIDIGAVNLIRKAGWILSVLMTTLCIFMAISGTLGWYILALNTFVSLIPLIYDPSQFIYNPLRFNSIYFISIVNAIFSIWISITASWWNLICIILFAIAPLALILYMWLGKHDDF